MLSLNEIYQNVLSSGYVSDKGTGHSYTEVYKELFDSIRFNKMNILEIGIDFGGSLLLWSQYFENSNIYGLDINDLPILPPGTSRITMLKMNAYDRSTIDYFNNQNIKFDLIIEDGDHLLRSQQFVLQNYIELLNPSGMMIVEDLLNEVRFSKLTKVLSKENRDKCEHYDRVAVSGRYDDRLLVLKT